MYEFFPSADSLTAGVRYYWNRNRKTSSRCSLPLRNLLPLFRRGYSYTKKETLAFSAFSHAYAWWNQGESSPFQKSDLQRGPSDFIIK